MPFLDIEKSIKSDEVASRFKLVHVAGIRARELNNPKESTIPQQSSKYKKVTTNALNELITKKITFTEATKEDPSKD